MAIDVFPMWHASLRHPAGNTPLPEGEPCMYTYICEFFVCVRTYLFVRAFLAKTLSTSTQEGRPEPVVELRARSEHCSYRGVPSKFVFFRWEWIRRFPGFLCMRPILYVCFFPVRVDKTISRASLYEAYFVRTYRKNNVCFRCPLSRAHSPRNYHRWTTEHAESTTLQLCRP